MINLKLRLQNKTTLVALISAAFLYAATVRASHSDQHSRGIKYFCGILVILGIVTDPTTKGIADSERALNYDVPLNDKKEK
ncbi:holin [Streptococcus phage STP1]|uniref:Holin n=1 Tax=Streptococcus phage STP1 TaxID=2041508 RepID=A0A2P0VJ56_9CAUD|nr:holin [Streptococcus phage STP1]ATI20029.1 holin [Streptococcus phage STP1]